MNRWKVAFLVLLAMFVVTNAFWMYVTVDAAVSYTYLESSFNDQRQAAAELGRLIVLGSREYSKKDVLHLLRQAKPNAFIVEEPNAISFEGITFHFESDKLVRVGDSEDA